MESKKDWIENFNFVPHYCMYLLMHHDVNQIISLLSLPLFFALCIHNHHRLFWLVFVEVKYGSVSMITYNETVVGVC